MPENIQQAIPLILLAIAFLILAWVMIRASRKTTIIDKVEGDVLDEGASPAARNQALIDSAPSAAKDTGVPLKATIAAKAPVPAAPETVPAPTPEPAPTPPPKPANDASSDDLKRIKGVGPKLVKILAEQGITRFEQIAVWTDSDVARIDATLGRFAGRIARDSWVEQAKLLAAGDEDSFNKTFGNNS